MTAATVLPFRPVSTDTLAPHRAALHGLAVGWDDLPWSDAEKWSMASRHCHPSARPQLAFLMAALRDAVAERDQLDIDPRSLLDLPLLDRHVEAEKHRADERVREVLYALVVGEQR